MSGYTTYQQHEPLRVPDGWNANERKLIVQLEEILDDLYRRFNRLKLTDLSKDLQTTIVSSETGVTQLTLDVNGLTSTVSGINGSVTTLEQTVDGITSTVTGITGNVTELEQTVNGLSATITDINGDVYALELSVSGLNSTVTSMSSTLSSQGSRITQTAEAINTKVSKGQIISEINQSNEAVLINANRINLYGYVTVAGLGAGGVTNIDGGRITTGRVSANRIDVDNLYVRHLNAADGTFTGNLKYSGGGYEIAFGYNSDNYDQPSLYPSDYKKCNIGTRSYAFDYMFANHFTDPSSRTIKKNIRELEDGDYDIMAFRPISYEMKASDTGLRSIGLIAEEVEEICPLLVTHAPDGAPCALEYSRFAVIAIREIQKLWREVSSLRAEIDALKTAGRAERNE